MFKPTHPPCAKVGLASHLWYRRVGILRFRWHGLFALGAATLCAKAGATLVSPGFPLINPSVGNYAVRVVYNSSAVAVLGDGKAGNQTYYPAKEDTVSIPLVSCSISYEDTAIANDTAATSFFGEAGRGVMKANMEVSVGDGPSQVSNRLIIDFIDKFHFDDATEVVPTPRLSGTGQHNDGRNSLQFAEVSAKFDTYIFSAVNPPAAGGTGFSPVYFGESKVTSQGTTTTNVPDSLIVPANTDWWVAARLEVTGSANINVDTAFGDDPGVILKAIGDFTHTAIFTIDTPEGGSYTTASGIDYHTASLVPEPASLTLFLAAACVMTHQRRRRKHQGPRT